MPDFNKYAAQTPYIRPEMPKSNGLAQIVQPVYDYVNTFPDSVDFGDAGKAAGIDLNIGEVNPFAHLGQAPIAPAAATPYNISSRFNSSDLMFLPTRDNEDLYAKNQGFFNSVGSGLGRLVLTTGTKLGTGIGYLGGLMGFGNHYEDYSPGFSGWIAGAADNGLKKWFENAEDQTIKRDWLPIYQEASDRDKGFFSRAATDLNFWTEDVSDGAAFMASAFVPGMAISKLGMGTALLRNLAFIRNMTAATEEGALLTEGLSGSVESTQALSKGLTTPAASTSELAGQMIENTPPGWNKALAATTRTSQEGLQELPRVFKWIDNAKLARSIDVGATTVINTASEAMFEADGVKKDLIDKLSQQKNADGSFVYTPGQVRTLAAKAAKDTYLMNLGALSMSNLWEANLFFKKLPSRAASIGEKLETKGLWDDVVLQKKTFGQRVLGASSHIGQGILAEGIWEENIQLAIQRMNESNENFDLDFTGKLGKLGTQYVKQTFDALSGQDPEAAMNIGIGGLMGGLAGHFLEGKGHDVKNSVSNLNSQVSFFKTLGNIYVTDDTGKPKLDEKGNPMVDVTKMKSYVASLNKVLNMQEVSRNLEERGVDELAQIYKDEVFARYAKAHFDNGLGQLLHDRLDNIKNITPEDMALLGYDPTSKDASLTDKVDSYKKRANDLEQLYDNINRNYLPFRKDKKGEKFYQITDKIFYMSARAQSLANQIRTAKENYDNVKNNADTYNTQFNSETDSTVEGYNQRYEALKAATRQRDIAYQQQYQVDEMTRPVMETRNGITVQAPSKLERLKKQNSSVAISLPTNFVEQNQETIDARQKELDQYVTDNKDTLEKMKKDSRGRYMFEIENKNLLPAAKEMERQQIIQAEFNLAHDNTMKAITRLSDLTFGEKYYDQVYAPAMARQLQSVASQSTEEDNPDDIEKPDDSMVPKAAPTEKVLNDDEIDKAYEQATEDGNIKEDKQDVTEHIANKIASGKSLNEKEEAIRQVIKDDVESELKKKKEKQSLGDLYDQERELNREKDTLEALDNRTDEQDQRLDEIYNQLDSLEQTRNEKTDEVENEMKVASSENIKPEDKEQYQQILNAISKNKSRVVKYDNYYEVDGVRYNKVTDIIGDTIPDDVRAKVQNAVNAGNTMDTIAKAFFNNVDDEEFRKTMGDKISDEAYDATIKQLQKIRSNLREKGIEIVGSNVVIFDQEKKVAGEIDLLGVDKNGNFKIYEIQARRQEIYKAYGLRGRGIKIRELDQQRLSAYRNMFANQYGAVPDEIAVMFPFQVKYDKASQKGYVESVDTRKAIRFTPSRSVQIKRKIFEPIRTGSKFDNIDLLRIFANTFLTNDDAKAKVRFLFRNVSLEDIKKKITMTVRNSEQQFQEKYNKQKALLDGHPTDYKLTKYPGFDNMYALSGNKEISVNHEGTLLGYMSPAKTLAYKDESGNFHVLDEHTDVNTYVQVTGNSEQTFPEFKRIAQSYAYTYGKLVDMLENSDKDEVVLDNDQVQELYEPGLSYGELDKVPTGEERPKLSELSIRGVTVGKKQVTTVAHIDANDSVMVMMDKTNKTNTAISKYQEVDKWVNNNLEDVIKSMTNKEGRRVTEHVAILQLPNGEYRVVPLKKNSNSKIENNEEFVTNLGDNFTTAVRKNVFKNEGVMMTPKFNEQMIDFDLKDSQITKSVYKGEDISSLEKFGLSPEDAQPQKHVETISDFMSALTKEQHTSLHKLYSAMGNDAMVRAKIMDDYNNSIGFSNMQDYLDYIKECKL